MAYYAGENASDDESQYVPSDDTNQTGRRVVLQDLLTEDESDKVMSAWEMFMKGPNA
jgi:hypothetical protein